MTIHLDEAACNITGMLVDQHIAANHGDRAAVRYGDRRYTYNDLAALVNRVGHLLRRSGLEPGDRLLVVLRPSPAFLGSVLGAMKVGVTAVVVEAAGDRTAIAGVLRATAPVAAVVDGERVAAVEGCDHRMRLFIVGSEARHRPSFAEQLREMPSSLVAERSAADRPAIILAGGSELTTVSHRDLLAMLSGERPADPGLAGVELLRFFKELWAGGEIAIGRGR